VRCNGSGPNQAAAQLRELANDELVSKLRESKEELFNLRFSPLPVSGAIIGCA